MCAVSFPILILEDSNQYVRVYLYLPHTSLTILNSLPKPSSPLYHFLSPTSLSPIFNAISLFTASRLRVNSQTLSLCINAYASPALNSQFSSISKAGKYVSRLDRSRKFIITNWEEGGGWIILWKRELAMNSFHVNQNLLIYERLESSRAA